MIRLPAALMALACCILLSGCMIPSLATTGSSAGGQLSGNRFPMDAGCGGVNVTAGGGGQVGVIPWGFVGKFNCNSTGIDVEPSGWVLPNGNVVNMQNGIALPPAAAPSASPSATPPMPPTPPAAAAPVSPVTVAPMPAPAAAPAAARIKPRRAPATQSAVWTPIPVTPDIAGSLQTAQMPSSSSIQPQAMQLISPGPPAPAAAAPTSTEPAGGAIP